MFLKRIFSFYCCGQKGDSAIQNGISIDIYMPELLQSLIEDCT